MHFKRPLFEKRTIIAALNEINKYSDIYVECTKVKINGFVDTYSFTCSFKKPEEISKITKIESIGDIISEDNTEAATRKADYFCIPAGETLPLLPKTNDAKTKPIIDDDDDDIVF